jgi:sugar lactone lactonase YvrE
VLHGAGAVSGRLRPCVARMTGALRGPGARDRGDWLAASGQTVQLPDGSLYLTAPSTHVMYRADNALSAPSKVFAGAVSTPGNIDGPRLSARMNMPGGLAFDPASSTLYSADVGNAEIRRLVLGSGQMTTLLRPSAAVAAAQAAGYPNVTGWEPQGVAVGSGGAVFITDARNYVVWKYSSATQQLKLLAGRPGTPGNADGSDTAVRFSGPQQIKVSPEGLIQVVDVVSQRLRFRDNGTWSTLSACC